MLAGRIADQSLRRLVAGPHIAVSAPSECRDRPRYRKPPVRPFNGVELIDFSTMCEWWTDAPVDPVRTPPVGTVLTLVLAARPIQSRPSASARRRCAGLGRLRGSSACRAQVMGPSTPLRARGRRRSPFWSSFDLRQFRRLATGNQSTPP